jgi:hypothetical protein
VTVNSCLARAHDQSVADDYFNAMQRVEKRLDRDEMVVKVQRLQLIEEPETLERYSEERLVTFYFDI